MTIVLKGISELVNVNREKLNFSIQLDNTQNLIAEIRLNYFVEPQMEKYKWILMSAQKNLGA